MLEIVLVFAVFCLQGAWPVPDVNEPYYVGKAIHFWNPAWAASDFFLNTADTHKVFYFAFGWLALWLSPPTLTWTLRLLTWGLLAWSWQRLSAAVVPRRWFSILSATLFVFLLQHFNMAGEWVVGGVEAKGIAFALMFFGLQSLVDGRWNRTWLFMGAASAFHVLVGFWAAIAAGLVWLGLALKDRRECPRGQVHVFGQQRCDDGELDGGKMDQTPNPSVRPKVPTLLAMGPALLVSLLLAMPGLIPSLALDWGKDAGSVREAHEIYVYQRLPHHLDPFRFPLVENVLPFVALCGLSYLLWRKTADDAGTQRLGRFVSASIAIAIVGFFIRVIGMLDSNMAASLLRFYWFRLADVAVPLGVALLGLRWVARRPARILLPAVVLLAGFHLADCAVLRLFAKPPYAERLPDLEAWSSAGRWMIGQGPGPTFPRIPRADRLPDSAAWRKACDWVAQSDAIPKQARFLVPRMSQTFKWYADRGEVVVWKEVPQDAGNMVDWGRRIQDIYATNLEPPLNRWYDWPTELTVDRLRKLADKYDTDYAIGKVTQPLLPLPVVYKNESYVIYELRPQPAGEKPHATDSGAK